MASRLPGRLLVPAALLAAACARGPVPGPANPGWSAAPAVSSGAAGSSEVVPWESRDRASRATSGSPAGPLRAPGGDLEGEVLASPGERLPAARPHRASRRPGQPWSSASSRRRAREPSVYFVMTKRAAGYDPGGGDWEYLVVVGSGHVEERGKLALCARCHAEAPHDRLFGGGPEQALQRLRARPPIVTAMPGAALVDERPDW